MFGFDDNPSPDAPALAIDLTSMIDVTFLLIIFWLIVANFAPAEPVRQLELAAASVSQSTSPGRPVILDVTTEPVLPIYLSGRPFSLAELDVHLAGGAVGGRDVVLRPDRNADADLVNRLARLCYRHGAAKVSFSLQAKPGGRP